MQDIEKNVAEILSLLLGKNIQPYENCSMKSCPTWDSIKHIEIIVTLEEKFDISFAAAEIPLLITQAMLVARIRELKNA